jgi:hypothetical protein
MKRHWNIIEYIDSIMVRYMTYFGWEKCMDSILTQQKKYIK